VKVFRKILWWQWLAAAGVVVGLVAGFYVGNRAANSPYTSSAEVLMTGQGDPTQVDSAYSSNQYVNQRMSTYAQIASSAQVTAPAARALGTDPATLAAEITAVVQGDTTVLSLAVTGPTPETAQHKAFAVTRSFIDAVTGLETNPGGSSRVVVNVITDPILPPARSVPPMWLLLVGGAIAGAVVGGLAALLLTWLYPQRYVLRTSADVEAMDPVAQAS
jgi:capsular polysaccharide biosynthesis protein